MKQSRWKITTTRNCEELVLMREIDRFHEIYFVSMSMKNVGIKTEVINNDGVCPYFIAETTRNQLLIWIIKNRDQCVPIEFKSVD